MRNGLIIAAIALPLAATGQKSSRKVALNYVADGDTLQVSLDGTPERIRLLRIDAPEYGVFGFAQARGVLRTLLVGKSITLEFEGRQRDKYNRLLAYVWANGKLANLECVRMGWCVYDRRFGEGKYRRNFERAEAEAKRKAIGFWAKPSANHPNL